jgi:kinesin family protein 1
MKTYLSRPYLYIYSHSNELEEVGVVGLDGMNVESDPQKEILLGVRDLFHTDLYKSLMFLQQRFSFTLFTSANSHALAAPNLKELQSWTSKLDPTRICP